MGSSTKAKAARPDVLVIAITAYGDAGPSRKAPVSGADALLTNPIDFTIVRDGIDMRIGHAACPREFSLPTTNRTGVL